MNRPSLKCWLIGAVVAVTLLSMAPQADAFWGWHGGRSYGYSACYWPCYSSCYSPCYSPCYGGYGSWGYSGWYGRGSCCGGYAAGGWSTSDTCCNGGATMATPGAPTPAPTPAKKPVEPTMPMEPTPAAPAPAQPAPPTTSGISAEDSGVLTVWVPNNAKVTVNGQETRSKGSRRQFISYGLKPGLSYKYVVKAEVVRDGEVQEDTRTIVLTAGEVTAVAFGFNVSQQVASAE